MVFRRAADSTLRFLEVEGPCAERTGLSKATLTGDAYSFWTRVDPDDRRRVLAALEEAIRKTTTYCVSYRLQSSDGPDRCVREEGVAVTDSDGEVVALEGLLLEAADELSAARRDQVRVDLQEAQDLFAAFAESSREMVATLGPGGLIEFANHRLCEELGRDVGALRSSDPATLVHPDDWEHVCAAAEQALATGEAGELLCRLKHADGGWFWSELHGSVVPVASGGRRGVVTGRNVESRVRAEDAALGQRLAEARVGKLSRRFIELGGEGFEEAIGEAIEAAGTMVSADRCYLMAFPSVRSAEIRSWAWQREGFEPWVLETDSRDAARNAWMRDRLMQGEIVRIPRPADLPDEYAPTRDHMLSRGIRSYCVIPVRVDGHVTALLGFQMLSSERDWSEHELALLRLVAEILASALRRREAEEALHEGEQRLRALAESAQDAICENDLEDGTILYANPHFYEVHGYDAESAADMSSFDFMHPEDLARVKSAHSAFLRGDLGPSFSGTFLYRGRHRDGRLVWLEANGRLYRTASGEARSAGVIRDVTDRELSQQSMRRRLENQKRIANMARDLLALGLDEMDGGVTDGLASLLPISGADRSWLIAADPVSGGQDAWEWTDDGVAEPREPLKDVSLEQYPHARSLFEAGRELLIAPGSELPEDAPETCFLRRRGVTALLVIPLLSKREVVGAIGFEMVGREHDWNDEAIALLRLGGEVFASAVSRKRAEQALRESRGQLLQAQKMEAVGTLAGGVAHDFNNQLSVILGNARFVHGQVSSDEDMSEALTDLERAAEYCAQLTRQLLSFSRHVPAEPRATCVSKVLRDVAELTGPLLSSSIRFEATAHDEFDAVYADRTQLQQVLVNLVVNARDAMPDGGNLSITTELRLLSATEAVRLELPGPGEFVEFVVTDTGFGMDENTIGRIFEPFFTTKEPGKGTGLGLATVYGILRESGGSIFADSELGIGTTFRLFLPRASGADEDMATPGNDGVQGGETLLLVDDDASVRRLMRRMLGRMGFQVLQAADGEEALRLGEAHPGDIDLLVSDVSMPGMGGVELGRRMLERRPTLRVLLVTGRAEDDVSLPGARILCKPFRQEELAHALEALLTQRS